MSETVAETVDVVAKAKELLSGVLEHMGIEAEVSASESEERIVLEIDTEHTDRIIGRRGQTIDALQHIVGKMLSRYREERGKPVQVDADGYRGRHVEKLESLAARMGEKAIESGEAVDLNPMNAYDRRIIHMALKEVEGVRTESEGEGDDRHVVVIPD
ncbi:MAG: KH domain-containing protein [Deltaproteobacteria bacterium]|nr:KH domain-containing protein [Deltaproteobacteria bacterium]